MEDTANSEVVEGNQTQGSLFLRRRSILTLAKPIVDDLLPCASDGDRVMKSVCFVGGSPILDTKCRNIREPHQVISEVESDLRSDRSSEQPRQDALYHTPLRGTTDGQQPLEEKVKKKGKISHCERSCPI